MVSKTSTAVGIKPKAPGALCHICPFKDKPCAQTTGPADAKIAVVSRSPGYYESLSGKSFSGPSGKVLDHLLKLQGIDRNAVLATNVVLCSSDGTEPGWQAAVAACSGRLERELQQAGTVIAAGAEAARALLGDVSVSRDRGYPHTLQLKSGKTQKVIITNNPAMVLREGSAFPELVRDFRLAINPLPKPQLPTVKWIENIDEAKNAAKEILNQLTVRGDDSEQLIATDIEARGVEGRTGLAHTSEIVCAGFSIRPERAVVFGEKPCYDSDFVTNYLKPLYEIEGIRYLWHNGKYDTKILQSTYGINARVDEDSMLLSWALDERPGDPESGAGGHSLEWLLKDELGWPKYEPQSVKHFKKTGEFLNGYARKELYEYNGMDTAGALALFSSLEQRARIDNVWDRPYKFMLIELSETLTKVELQGNLFDADVACDILENEVWPKLRELKIQARQLVSKPNLNLNSPKQLQELYYNEWGVKHGLARAKIERKGKLSTDHYVREEILRDNFQCNTEIVHPETVKRFTKTYDDFKSLDKQRGTYFEGLVLRRFPNGRIYTDFKIHGTESGRLSSSNPNLQNVTRPKEGIPSIRSAFIADPGCQLISTDLSQAELRTIAVLSNDKGLQDIYLNTGRSLHKEVATEFYGKDYTYEQYVRAKNINFGVAYWQSAYSFAQLYHMPEVEAQKFIDFWWDRFPQVWEWTKAMERKVLEVGEIQSPFGHKRRFYVIPSDKSAKIHTIKQGINFLPQNIAGNITLWAMIRLAEDLDWDKAQIRINVHDNIVLNCRQEFVDEIAHMTVDYMKRAPQEAIGWQFPFNAEVSVGHNWGSLEDYNLG